MSRLSESSPARFQALVDRLAKPFRRPPPAMQPLLTSLRIRNNSVGGGAFGRWILDEAGLPAYEYKIDQFKDARARYVDSQGIVRHDHWHQIGNDHITALASNDGVVQVYLCDRGGVFLNRFEADRKSTPAGFDLSAWIADPIGQLLTVLARLYRTLREWWYRWRVPAITQTAHTRIVTRDVADPELLRQQQESREAELLYPPAPPHTYAGGFGYLEDGAAVWATAFAYRQPGAQTRRVFGLGYYETMATYHQLRTTRRVVAPYGDDPLLLIDVTIENLNPNAVDLRYYEYWDVNVHQLELQWLRTGVSADIGDGQRRAINDKFTPSIHWDAQARALRFHQTPSSADALPPDQPSRIDWIPADVFLADLNDTPPAAHFTQRNSFFGSGNARQPEVVHARINSEVERPPDGSMPYCMVLKRDLHLEPNAPVTLRFAYGAAQPDQPLTLLDRYRAKVSLDGTLEQWKRSLVYFMADDRLDLSREMAWHAYNLLSATVYNAYYDVHLVPQGSAYLYLHGADGAPRDQSLFAIPLTYLRPDLARDTLRLIMRMTDGETGAIPYAFAGYGIHDGAGVHEHPSDLDLFFLLGLGEYLAATGDLAFLDSVEPYYPRGSRLGTVLDHVRTAVDHLLNAVGIGENNLIKVGDGDWSDSIILETWIRHLLEISRANSIAHGESIPNTQMALYVLPLTAALIETRDPALADRLRATTERLKEGVQKMWREDGWFVRAVLRDGANEPIYWREDQIDLEAQPWALISDLADDLQVKTKLIDTIVKQLDRPSPIGATLTAGSMVWPAISQLLTWGYAHSGKSDRAWHSFTHNTYTEHARIFPDVWFNIWTGPDGVNSTDGRTWSSPLTPMTDFPAMNANQDAMALLGMLRVCGIEPAPTGDGLIITPPTLPKLFALDMPLLRLEKEPGRIAGEYRAIVKGQRVLHVRVPGDAVEVSATLDGQSVTGIPRGATEVTLKIAFDMGQKVSFEVRWSSPPPR